MGSPAAPQPPPGVTPAPLQLLFLRQSHGWGLPQKGQGPPKEAACGEQPGLGLGLEPGSFSAPPPSASLTFSTGMYCPALRGMFVLKKKKKKSKIERERRPPRALRSSKINDVVKGKLSSNHSAGEMFSRPDSQTLPASSPQGKPPGTWAQPEVPTLGCSFPPQLHLPAPGGVYIIFSAPSAPQVLAEG